MYSYDSILPRGVVELEALVLAVKDQAKCFNDWPSHQHRRLALQQVHLHKAKLASSKKDGQLHCPFAFRRGISTEEEGALASHKLQRCQVKVVLDEQFAVALEGAIAAQKSTGSRVNHGTVRAFLSSIVHEQDMTMLHITHSALCRSRSLLGGRGRSRDRALIGQMTLLSAPETGAHGCLGSSSWIRLFASSSWWVAHSGAFALALSGLAPFSFSFSTFRRSFGRWWARRRKSWSQVGIGISECNDGQIAPCQLDVIEPLAGIQVCRIGTVIGGCLFGCRLKFRFGNFIAVVGSFFIKGFLIIGLIGFIVAMVAWRLRVGVILFPVLPIARLSGAVISICIVAVGLVRLIVHCIAAALAAIAGITRRMTGHCFMVLAQQQEESLLDFVALQGRRLCDNQLPLLSAQASFAQQVPSLHLSRQGHTVVSQAVVELVMLGAEIQECLTRSSLKRDKVPIKIGWQLHSIVVLEGFVESLQDSVKGSSLLHIFNGKGLKQLPRCAREASDQIQKAFRLLLQHAHLGHVDLDALAPFTIVLGCSWEQRNVAILGGALVEGCAAGWSSARHGVQDVAIEQHNDQVEFNGCKARSWPRSQGCKPELDEGDQESKCKARARRGRTEEQCSKRSTMQKPDLGQDQESTGRSGPSEGSQRAPLPMRSWDAAAYEVRSQSASADGLFQESRQGVAPVWLERSHP